MNFSKDRELVVAIRRHVDEYMRGKELTDQVYLALDCECKFYSFDEAKRMATLLGSLEYEWFEAPLPDRDFEVGVNWGMDAINTVAVPPPPFLPPPPPPPLRHTQT